VPGIHLADELRPLERDLAYVQLIASSAQPHFFGYYAIVMGLQDRPWNDCRGVEKIALCALLNYISIVFQTTVITKKGHTLMDATLTEISVIDRA